MSAHVDRSISELNSTESSTLLAGTCILFLFPVLEIRSPRGADSNPMVVYPHPVLLMVDTSSTSLPRPPRRNLRRRRVQFRIYTREAQGREGGGVYSESWEEESHLIHLKR